MLPGNVDRCGKHFSLQFDSGLDLECGSKINLAGRGKFKKDTICFC